MSLWIGLDERGEDLGMFSEVGQEGIATPASHNLHGFQGEAEEEIKKGGTNADTMALEGFEACQPSGRGKAFDEGWFGEGAELVLVPVSEQVGVCGGAVDVKVILEGSIWVSGSRVGAPVDVLAFELSCLGAWDVQDSDFEAIRIAVYA